MNINSNLILFNDNLSGDIFYNNLKIYDTIGIIQSPLYEEDKDLFKENVIENRMNEFDDSFYEDKRYYINNSISKKIDKPNELIINGQINKIENLGDIKSTKTTVQTSLIKDIAQINSYSNKKYNSKNMGRKIKEKTLIENNINVHDKTKEDNIRLKFKRIFFKYLIESINYEIAKNPKLKKQGKIMKLDSRIIKNSKKDHILAMLDLSAAEYLSNDISKKNKKLPKEHNKKLIQFIYDINETNIIKILEKSIRELIKIFCSGNDEENIFKFKRLQYYIDNILIAEKHENENYILKFKEQAINYEEKYKELHGRKENK